MYLTSVFATLVKKIDVLIELLIGQMTPTAQSLLESMVFGKESGYLDQFSHYFEITGMQHVLVASGSNIALLLMFTKVIVRRFCPFLLVSRLVLMLVLVIYVMIVGADPPILRAGLMATMSFLCEWFHRQYRAWYFLLVAAAVMVACNKEYLTNVSFQLSVSATLGVIYVLPILTGYESWLGKIEKYDFSSSSHKVGNPLSESLLVTIAAQSFTLPLVLHHFGQFSLVSIIANTLLLWLVPLITISGFTYFFVGALLVVSLGTFSLVCLSPLLLWIQFLIDLFVRGVRFFGGFESLLIHVSCTWWQVYCWWMGLVLIILNCKNKQCYENF